MVKIFTKASNVKNYQANAEYNYMYPKELISDLIIRRGISFGMIKKSDSLKSYLAKRDILLYSKYNDNINAFEDCFQTEMGITYKIDDLADDILAELGQEDDFQQENAAPEEASQPADVEPDEEA